LQEDCEIDALSVEASMPHPRTVKGNILFVFLAVVAFLISGIVTPSPTPRKQRRRDQPGNLYDSRSAMGALSPQQFIKRTKATAELEVELLKGEES
jgi:hypothetical protein